jgi:hypothetical protein
MPAARRLPIRRPAPHINSRRIRGREYKNRVKAHHHGMFAPPLLRKLFANGWDRSWPDAAVPEAPPEESCGDIAHRCF